VGKERAGRKRRAAMTRAVILVISFAIGFAIGMIIEMAGVLGLIRVFSLISVQRETSPGR
jgi:hypothetical protein